MSLFNRLRFHLRHAQFDTDLQAEMLAHVQEKEQELLEAGMSTEDAHFAARRSFGNPALLQEQSRDTWVIGFLDRRARDLRYSWRMAARNPLFTLVVVLSLAVGIGASSAIFTVIDTLMLRPLPVAHPYQLADIRRIHADGSVGMSFNYPLYRAIRDRVKSFSGVIGSTIAYLHRLRIDGNSAGFAQTQLVSGNYFKVLGVTPVLGRALGDSDDRTSAPAVVVLSYQAWQKHFGMHQGVIGRTVELDEKPFAIVGVAPKGFRGIQVGADPDFWAPLHQIARFDPEHSTMWIESPETWWFLALARLSPGTSWSHAEKECDFVAHQEMLDYVRQHSGGDKLESSFRANMRFQLAPGFAGTGWQVLNWSKPLWLVFGAVMLLLLIACANVATLLLARAAARRHEIAVQLSLGASRARIISQLVAESALLAMTGGAIGLALAHPAAALLIGFVPHDPTFQPVTTPDVRVLLFTSAVSVLSAIVFGTAPALRATRVNVASTVRETSASVTAHGGTLALDKTLITGQVALSLLLIMSAGLMVRTVRNLRASKMGFNPHGVVVFDTDMPRRYEPERLAAAYRQILQQLDTITGVEASGSSSFNLLSGGGIDWAFVIPGYKPLNESDKVCDVLFVAGDFFRAMGIPLLAGRSFDARESQPVKNPAYKPIPNHPETAELQYAPTAAVVNEEFARHYLHSINVIGRQINGGLFAQTNAPPIQIIGVVGNTKYVDLRESNPRTVFLPALQVSVNELMASTFEVRTRLSSESIVPAVQRVLSDSGLDAQPTNFRTMDQIVADSISQERLLASLSSFFGAFALLLTAIGLYGVVAYAVVRRTREIGVRIALGATAARVARLIAREIAVVTLLGISAGLFASYFAGRLLATRVFELSVSDPLTLFAAAVVMLGITMTAAALPTVRATRIEPMTAIRYE